MKWKQLYSNLNILWHCLSLGLKWKVTFSSPVATAEFSKFAGILCAALRHLKFNLLLLLSRFSHVQHRQQPTRLPRPWDSPGKNTGMGCYFLLQCMKVKSESEVTQSCPTLSDPMDYSLPGSVHGIFQARVLEWGAMAFSQIQSKLN